MFMVFTGVQMAVQNVQRVNHLSAGGANGGQRRRGMVLPFEPLSLAFNHVNYFVDMPVVSQFPSKA